MAYPQSLIVTRYLHDQIYSSNFVIDPGFKNSKIAYCYEIDLYAASVRRLIIDEAWKRKSLQNKPRSGDGDCSRRTAWLFKWEQSVKSRQWEK
ncbi:hypothetical protein Zmor_021175 [Zophobas morio]|uniref:Uncharacterized protein n=1 Tax=Zophobas morio TaxID=2755281 RepID=A0AA38MB45_9CUCU|nr:hypothetical protein Zmor_021175 [Zophobas morio]